MTASRSRSNARPVAPRCNIGPEEIARRRRMTIALIVVTAIVAAYLVVFVDPGAARLLVWPFASAASVTGLQVVHRFCVRFGATGVENFGPLGREVAVDPEHRAADRRRAIQVILEGSLLGLAVALLVALISA